MTETGRRDLTESSPSRWYADRLQNGLSKWQDQTRPWPMVFGESSQFPLLLTERNDALSRAGCIDNTNLARPETGSVRRIRDRRLLT